MGLAANAFSNPTLVAAEALRHLENNCVMGNLVYRGYDIEFKQRPRGWNIGNTITIKTPAYFRVTDGRDMTGNLVSLQEQDTTFVVNQWKNVGWTLTAEEMTLDLDKWSKRFLKPAMQALSNYIDLSLLGLYTDIPNQVGTPGTTPNNFYVFAQAAARLDEEACPTDDRYCVIDPQAQARLTDHLKGLFQQAMVTKSIEKNKIIDQFAGFKMFMSQNVNTHTNGTWASVIVVQKNLIATERDPTHSLKSDGNAQTLTHGDIFTYNAVNSVNPVSGMSTGSLRQFVVDKDDVLTAGGAIAALEATPGTDPYQLNSGAADATTFLPYQNHDVLPQDDAAVTIAGTASQQYKVNMAFHKHTFGLVMVPIEIPASAAWKATVSHGGYTIQVLRWMDGLTYTEYIRFDVLYGVKTLNPFLGCRIAG